MWIFVLVFKFVSLMFIVSETLGKKNSFNNDKIQLEIKT